MSIFLSPEPTNHAQADSGSSRMPDRHLTGPDHLCYYYYPSGMGDPERFMPIVRDTLRAWRDG
jgi:hypothetical protein